MPAERAGSSPGGQGKAVPVEETAVQLSLPIATAESPRGATRRRTRDRLGAIRAGVPKAIVNAENVTSATMEEVANRLTSALLRVASNKGAPGPDGQTIEALVDQCDVCLSLFPKSGRVIRSQFRGSSWGSGLMVVQGSWRG